MRWRLCRLEKIDPTDQDFGECASFAVVSLHDVAVDVSMVEVKPKDNGFGSPSEARKSGIKVSLTPVESKNLAGVAQSFTTSSSNDPSTTADDRRAHNFDPMAAGSYDLEVSDGWRAMAGDPPVKADGMFDPLGGDVDIEVTPKTATLYGFVRDQNSFGLEGVTVNVNGMTATTDDLGRYIVTGIPDSNGGQLVVSVEREGYPKFSDNSSNANTTLKAFAANTAEPYNITLSGANNTVTITGTVKIAGTGAPLSGVAILVDGDPPLNATGGALKTGSEGRYTAIIEARPTTAAIVNVSAQLDGWHFLPRAFPVPAIAGSSGTANFEGREAAEITGRVTMPGSNNPMRDVKVIASDASGTILDEETTTETGTFSLSVPTLSGTVTLEARPLRLSLRANMAPTTYPTRAEVEALVTADRYVWFDAPDHRTNSSIAVIPGQPLNFGTFQGHSVQPRITKVERVTIDEFVEAPGDVHRTVQERPLPP